MRGMPVLTLSVLVSALGDNNDDAIFGFDFSAFPEAVAGQAITASTVEYKAEAAGAPALAKPTSTSVAGAVSGSQVQVEVKPAAACAGYLYSFTATATFSGGDVRNLRGLLTVLGPA